MRRLLAVVVVVLAWPSAAHARVPIAHAASTCADYKTQADAQRAADTRDADGDGVYCEDLPCPCLAAGGQPTGGDQSTSPTPRLGRSATFGKVSRRQGCRAHDGLPDRRCTPGAYYAKPTKRAICQPGYSSEVRKVSESMKDTIYRDYGVRHHTRATYEIDHLVPLELGGSNIKANLFAEAASPKPGFHQKDRLENALHRRVCDGTMGLRQGQRLFATNWLRAYRRYVDSGA
jgi:hypothetical protein